MAKNCIRIGIIGCGGIANGKHMPALSKISNVKMVAFCDIIEERARAAKEKTSSHRRQIWRQDSGSIPSSTIPTPACFLTRLTR